MSTNKEDSSPQNPDSTESKNLNRILIVDDEPDILEILKFYLSNLGLDVDTASNAQRAIELVHKNEYLFCITDLDMPKISGVELINTLRLLRPAMPTCICSAKVTEFAHELTRIAVSTTLPKPFFKEDLEKCVKILSSKAHEFRDITPPDSHSPIVEAISTELIYFAPSDLCKDIITKMGAKDIGCVLIIENDHLVGIFTERDVLHCLSKHGSSFLENKVELYMTKNVETVDSQFSIDNALSLMEKKKFRHLPILDKEKVVGVVSIRDLVRFRLNSFQRVVSSQMDLIKRLQYAENNKKTK